MLRRFFTLKLGMLAAMISFASPSFASEFEYIESGFCAPGLPCYQSPHESSLEQLVELSKTSEFGNLEERRLASNKEVVRSNQIFYSDDRQLKSRKQGQELAPIGVVTFNGRMHTGSLIGRCHILTNVHAATLDWREIDLENPPTLTFEIGQREPKGFAQSINAKPVALGPFQKIQNNFQDDWMVLKLDSCVGDTYGWLEVEAATTESAVGAKDALELAGYGVDQTYFNRGIWLDPNCTVQSNFSGMWLHDCSVVDGSSGGPILKRGRDGKSKIVAIHSATLSDVPEFPQEWTVEKSNIATHMNHFYSQISKFLGK